MDEKQIEAIAKELREKASQTKNNEKPEDTKARMKQVLQNRDKAMQSIYSYQEKTGVPTKEETEKNFLENEIKQN